MQPLSITKISSFLGITKSFWWYRWRDVFSTNIPHWVILATKIFVRWHHEGEYPHRCHEIDHPFLIWSFKFWCVLLMDRVLFIITQHYFILKMSSALISVLKIPILGSITTGISSFIPNLVRIYFMIIVLVDSSSMRYITTFSPVTSIVIMRPYLKFKTKTWHQRVIIPCAFVLGFGPTKKLNGL